MGRILEYTITIKGELTDLNKFIDIERKNRYEGARLKKENTEFVMWQTKGLEKMAHYPVHVHITWITKNTKIDPDNTAFAKKFILDALVNNEIIKDDSRKYIKGFADEYEVDADNPRMVVRLTWKGK